MTHSYIKADKRIEEHRARLQLAGGIPMTVEEILAGQTQGGVPRPAFLRDHDDDGTIETVAPIRGEQP